MEGNDIMLKLSLIWVEAISFLSILSHDPLFSCIVTFYTLIFLYLPPIFYEVIFSPVIALTGILLLNILRIGAVQRSQNEEKENSGVSELTKNDETRAIQENREEIVSPSENESADFLDQFRQRAEQGLNSEMGFQPTPYLESSFVGWNVRAPLQVIYEAYEDEGEEEAGEDSNKKEDNPNKGIERYPSLSLYYPESDSDSSSDGDFPAIGKWGSPENICFRWEEEDREELIEIHLDGSNKGPPGFHVEEENMIEINISPSRHNEFSGES